MHLRSSPTFGDLGDCSEHVATVEDITGRKRTEAQRDELLAREQAARVEAEQARDQLKELSRQLVEAQETERRRIARELHDEVGQLLTMLKLALDTCPRLPPESIKTKLREQSETVNELVRIVRKMSIELRPAILDDLGLLPALFWFCDRYSAQTQIAVDLRHEGIEKRRFPRDVETAAYRVVQEALTNVARHARTDRVIVRTWADARSVACRSRIKGEGFIRPKRWREEVRPGCAGCASACPCWAGNWWSIRPRAQEPASRRSFRGTKPPRALRNRMSKITIVLADDHNLVRQGLRALLTEEPDFSIVGEAADGVETMRLVNRVKPDILVLDLIIPSLNGLEVTREVRRRHPATRVIILSMYENEAYVSEAIRNGASGYVLKCSTSADLVKAIREAVAGRCYLSSALSIAAIEAYSRRTKTGKLDRYETLTTREREVFHLTAEGHTSAEIARRLFISSRTVEIHRANMLRKLKLHNQTDVVRFAIERGILPLDRQILRAGLRG